MELDRDCNVSLNLKYATTCKFICVPMASREFMTVESESSNLQNQIR